MYHESVLFSDVEQLPLIEETILQCRMCVIHKGEVYVTIAGYVNYIISRHRHSTYNMGELSYCKFINIYLHYFKFNALVLQRGHNAQFCEHF